MTNSPSILSYDKVAKLGRKHFVKHLQNTNVIRQCFLVWPGLKQDLSSYASAQNWRRSNYTLSLYSNDYRESSFIAKESK